jgi:hypothetical protein
MAINNEVIFFTQIVSIIGFVGALFVLYRVLIQQKDGVIELLRERIVDKDDQIVALKAQTSDALASALAERIKMSLDEISRLKSDGNTHIKEIESKEEDLRTIQGRLTSLFELIRESDLLCPQCEAPLVRRQAYTIHGGPDGDWEAELEYVEYQCGLAIDGHGFEKYPCRKQFE